MGHNNTSLWDDLSAFRRRLWWLVARTARISATDLELGARLPWPLIVSLRSKVSRKPRKKAVFDERIAAELDMARKLHHH